MFLDKGDAYRFQDELLRLAEELAFIRLSLSRLEKPPPDIEVEQDISINDAPAQPELEVIQDIPIENGAQPELALTQDIALEGINSVDVEVEADLYAVSPQQLVADIQIKIEQIEDRLRTLAEQQPTIEQQPGANPASIDAAKIATRLHEAYGIDGRYEAENYLIERVDDTYRVYDAQGQEVLTFKADNDRYEILSDHLSPQQSRDFKRIQSLRNIASDLPLAERVETLVNLAPKGSQAAQIANLILEGRHSKAEQFKTYSFSRRNGELTIERDGNVILQAKNGTITQNLTAQDQQSFQRIHEIAQEQVNDSKLEQKESKAKKLAIRR